MRDLEVAERLGRRRKRLGVAARCGLAHPLALWGKGAEDGQAGVVRRSVRADGPTLLVSDSSVRRALLA